MDATRNAWLSSQAGKIILAVSVFTCFHFKAGGLPPNCWAVSIPEIKMQAIE
jgi:hypothetical protein